MIDMIDKLNSKTNEIVKQKNSQNFTARLIYRLYLPSLGPHLHHIVVTMENKRNTHRFGTFAEDFRHDFRLSLAGYRVVAKVRERIVKWNGNGMDVCCDLAAMPRMPPTGAEKHTRNLEIPKYEKFAN